MRWPAAILAAVAVAGITVMETVALLHGVNGVLLTVAVGSVAALGGYGGAKILKVKKEIRDG